MMLTVQQIITLQYHWGMQKDKLFLHSRYNVAIGMSLSSSIDLD